MGPRRVEALFIPSPAIIFLLPTTIFFLLSLLGVFSWNFGGVFAGALKCTFGVLGLSCDGGPSPGGIGKNEICSERVKKSEIFGGLLWMGSTGEGVQRRGVHRGGGPAEEGTDFGQSRSGHPDLANLGQSNFGRQSIFGHLGFGLATFGQIQFWPIQFGIWCALSRHLFCSFCVSLGVFSLNFGVFFEGGDLKCARLGSRAVV